MGDVVYLADRKRKASPSDVHSWVYVRLDYVNDVFAGAVLQGLPDIEPGPERAAALKDLASDVWKTAGYLRADAADMEGDSVGENDLLGGCMIFASSRVWSWINDAKVASPAQFDWMDRRFDEAKGAIRPESK